MQAACHQEPRSGPHRQWRSFKDFDDPERKSEGQARSNCGRRVCRSRTSLSDNGRPSEQLMTMEPVFTARWFRPRSYTPKPRRARHHFFLDVKTHRTKTPGPIVGQPSAFLTFSWSHPWSRTAPILTPSACRFVQIDNSLTKIRRELTVRAVHNRTPSTKLAASTLGLDRRDDCDDADRSRRAGAPSFALPLVVHRTTRNL
jgi:hypothetical protein